MIDRDMFIFKQIHPHASLPRFWNNWLQRVYLHARDHSFGAIGSRSPTVRYFIRTTYNSKGLGGNRKARQSKIKIFP